MISRNQLKYYSGLLKKKDRNIENKFIVEGRKIVEEGIKQIHEFNCELIISNLKFAGENKDFLSEVSANYKIPLEVIKNQDFSKLTDTKNPQGIIAVFKKPPEKVIENINSNPVVFLDEIADPGNVGTILRNCDWFGVSDVILSDGCADVYNPKTLRSSMGSVFHINIYENFNLKTSLKILKEKKYKILCSDLDGENIFHFKNVKKNVIIFSSESHGPSKDVINLADKKITIPKYGSAESLNVASASAVILSCLRKV